jgi:hypothetical protein
MTIGSDTVGMTPIAALFTQALMRRSLTGAHAQDPVAHQKTENA